MLVDHQLREALTTGELVIDPLQDKAVQPASVDVRLGRSFATYSKTRVGTLDPKKDQSEDMDVRDVGPDGCFLVMPDELVLAHTHEEIGLGISLVARIEGKSSLGRLGLLVHSTAGFIDPGWQKASITLEISSVSGLPIRLYPGMPIAQLAVERVQPASTAYRGKYVRQRKPEPSRYHQNWTGNTWA